MKTVTRLVLVLAASLALAPWLAAQEFSNLTKLRITVENLDADSLRLGLTEELLKSQILIALKRDIPKVLVSASAHSMLYVNITTQPVGAGYSAVFLSVRLERAVHVLDEEGSTSQGFTVATVWDKGILFTGDNNTIKSRILSSLSDRLTLFAAEYYKANS
jgi:hypothetical protein